MRARFSKSLGCLNGGQSSIPVHTFPKASSYSSSQRARTAVKSWSSVAIDAFFLAAMSPILPSSGQRRARVGHSVPHPDRLPPMAEPTLKDVLNAIAQMRAEMATKTELAKLDAKVDAFEAKVDAFEAKADARFDKVDKAIAELDSDLDRHMKVHKEIDKRLDALKARPAKVTARMPRRR